MFGPKDQEGLNGNQIDDTIIGSTIKIEGDLVSNGNIVVEGEVSGSLKTEKSLRVGAQAKVKADVKAADAYICGEVVGNISVNGRIELAETAKVTGDVNAGEVVINAGATFNGRCTMGEASSGVKVKELESEAENQ